MYQITIGYIKECRLVHAGISPEYNLLYHEGHIVVIDVSQATEGTSPRFRILMDCMNILKFFRGKGLENFESSNNYSILLFQRMSLMLMLIYSNFTLSWTWTKNKDEEILMKKKDKDAFTLKYRQAQVKISSVTKKKFSRIFYSAYLTSAYDGKESWLERTCWWIDLSTICRFICEKNLSGDCELRSLNFGDSDSIISIIQITSIPMTMMKWQSWD